MKGRGEMDSTVRVELLWFEGCPNHIAAEALTRDVMAELGIAAPIIRVEVPDEETGIAVRFPGSPTVRINGRDIEPGFADCDDCTPRCRVYFVDGRMTGVPARDWIVKALTG